MPVRFKGLSEYQRNFLWKKSYLSESCNSSVGRKYPWAGLRSDQLGITKEPSFISKRRVPYHDPQISKSLEWNGAISESNVVASPDPEAPETPKSQEAEQKDVTQERVHSLEASRVPKRTRSHSADSRAEGASDVENNEGVTNHTPVNENVELEHSTKVLSENVDNGVGIFTAFLFKSIEFFVGFVVIAVILHFVFQNFPLFSYLMSLRIVDNRLLTLVIVN
ncbi:MDM1 isoform 13 [Pongo abelii]|uniref:Nuclear protein MDM1 n=1 Tax=Pongo abelii TaxID=9601 RepID=A0A2J8W0U3_PONAB|nr:MDM1 isoform 13 [Pongo abelii]